MYSLKQVVHPETIYKFKPKIYYCCKNIFFQRINTEDFKSHKDGSFYHFI